MFSLVIATILGPCPQCLPRHALGVLLYGCIPHAYVDNCATLQPISSVRLQHIVRDRTGVKRRCQLSLGTRRAQAVARGDAVTVGQAWQQVQAGRLQPDIDSLNTLLKRAPSQYPPLLHPTRSLQPSSSNNTLIQIPKPQSPWVLLRKEFCHMSGDAVKAAHLQPNPYNPNLFEFCCAGSFAA